MKRFLAMVLALVMVLSMVPALGIAAHAETTTEQTNAKPFYALHWGDANRRQYPNMDGLPTVSVSVDAEGEFHLDFARKSDLDKIVKELKGVLEDRPEGMRYIYLRNPNLALTTGLEAYVYSHNGFAKLEAVFTAFVQAYAAIGGPLDGVILDTEYLDMKAWYLFGKSEGSVYAEQHKQIYLDIVNHELYQTEIRPQLVERGFPFYNETAGVAEIYSILPYQYWGLGVTAPTADKTQYANAASIWDAVMQNREVAYYTEALYEPLKAAFPACPPGPYLGQPSVVLNSVY